MDNLSAMIKEALSDVYEPDEYLIRKTAAAMRDNKKQDLTLVNLIFILNMTGVILILFALFNPVFYVIRFYVFFSVLFWLSAIIPVYFIARTKLTKAY